MAETIGPTSEWRNLQTNMLRKRFTCGYCGSDTGVRIGFDTDAGQSETNSLIYICGRCNRPNYFESAGADRRQTPAPMLGNDVEGLPGSVATIYEEARRCTAAGAYTSCVLTCRKLLMHLAAEEGADEGQSFVKYIEYLEEHHYIPPNGKAWVDKIRKAGNEANHELTVSGRDDAFELLSFAEMLLKFIYEFPARVKIDVSGES